MLCPRQIRAQATLYALRDDILGISWPSFTLNLQLYGDLVPSTIVRVCIGTNIRCLALYAAAWTRFCLPISMNRATQVCKVFVCVRR